MTKLIMTYLLQCSLVDKTGSSKTKTKTPSRRSRGLHHCYNAVQSYSYYNSNVYSAKLTLDLTYQ